MNPPYKESKFGFTSNFGINYMENERQRISGELHDNVSSKLTVIRHMLLSKPDSVDEIIDLLDKTVITLRKISHNLHLPFLDRITLIEALRDFLQPLHGLFKIELYDLSRVHNFVGKPVKLHIFRIVQEVINNILRHAQASLVYILFKITNKELRLVIRDNGVGSSEQNKNCHGLGLRNIACRANKLNASYKFKSFPGRGTSFILSVPLINQLRES